MSIATILLVASLAVPDIQGAKVIHQGKCLWMETCLYVKRENVPYVIVLNKRGGVSHIYTKQGVWIHPDAII